MMQKNTDNGNNIEKICFQYACPRYPGCSRARGKGCCIDYPENEEELVRREECRAEDGYPLYMGEE